LNVATAAGLPGTYKAWLSDSTMSASSRLTHATSPYVLVDGTQVAPNWAQLTSGSDLLHAINLTESGHPPPVATFKCGTAYPAAWTDTYPNGNEVPSGVDGGGLDCNDWTSSTGAYALVGLAVSKTAPAWTQYCQSNNWGPSSCADTASLYCMQQ
jgi:hypothetical protein